MENKKKVGRPTKNIIKPHSSLPFEIELDFLLGNTDKYKKNKKIIQQVKKDIDNYKKENND